MPFDRSRYPTNWEEISHRIRFDRAGGKCEKCGLPHGAVIVRNLDDPAEFLIYDPEKDRHYHGWDGAPVRISDVSDEYDFTKHHKVILTTHHMGAPYPDGTPGDVHNKMDCRDENLIALCQRCHFLADLPHHIISSRKARAANKRKRKLEAGQLQLWSDES